MFLATDIGNTNIVLSLHDGKEWCWSSRIKTSDTDVLQKFEELLKEIRFEDSVLSSVVPKLTEKVEILLKKHGEGRFLRISNKIKTGLDASTVPDELGADILCNMIAAHYFFPDNYVTVADFGTAFTTSTVSPEGRILGVTIAPGMMTSVKALFSNTAQLPEIKLDLPKSVLGLNTLESIRAGVIFGFTGQLDAIVKQIEKELGQQVKVVATGGFSRYVTGLVDKLDLADINFTLNGAKIAFDLNCRTDL